MVESMANSVEDFLIDGLSFKLKPGASYINERKYVTYHTQGGNQYTPTGVKVMKFQITGDQWLDPSSFRVGFDLYNDETTALKNLFPLSGPHSFFRRLRVLCNGQVVEDIDDYNRVHEMFINLQPQEKRDNDEVEGFCNEWDTATYLNSAIPSDGTLLSRIFPGDFRRVLFRPLSGLLTQPKYIPLRYCPLTIELELVNKAEEPVARINTTNFKVANTSIKWRIENAVVKCDVCTLDNALDNSYAEHLLSGKSLPINYNTFISQIQSTLASNTTGQKNVRLNVTRALSRLKSVFITFYRDHLAAISTSMTGRNKFNTFYSPAQISTDTAIPNVYGFEFQLQLGNKLYPEYPITSHQEAYYHLKKAVGGQNNKYNTMSIKGRQYQGVKFILGMDMERVLEAGFTGQNTRAGDILNVNFSHNGTDTRFYAQEMHIILHSDNILEIRDSGVQVFD